MSKIFISYRRDDTGNYVGRIYDSLSNEFGEDNVFLDTEKIIDGTHFPKRLTRAVTNSDVVLVIIGKEWLSLVNDAGEVRIHTPGDWVRYEIQLALNLEKQVIPILLNHSSFPTKTDLPKDIQELVHMDGRVINIDQDFETDINKLIEDIKAKPILDAAKRDYDRRNYFMFGAWLIVALIILFGGAFGAFYFANQGAETSSVTSTPYFANVILGESINIRAEPNNEARIIAIVTYPTQLTVIEQNEDGFWVKVVLSDGTNGWTFTRFILDNITATGDFQSELGCERDWMPECPMALLTDDDGDGIYTWTTTFIPIGNWEVKIAYDGTWDENYGLVGERDGSNIPFEVSEENQEITFTYDSFTHLLSIETE